MVEGTLHQQIETRVAGSVYDVVHRTNVGVGCVEAAWIDKIVSAGVSIWSNKKKYTKHLHDGNRV